MGKTMKTKSAANAKNCRLQSSCTGRRGVRMYQLSASTDMKIRMCVIARDPAVTGIPERCRATGAAVFRDIESKPVRATVGTRDREGLSLRAARYGVSRRAGRKANRADMTVSRSVTLHCVSRRCLFLSEVQSGHRHRHHRRHHRHRHHRRHRHHL